MNNNTFVQLLMDIGKKKKTKQNLKAKGLNEITYSHGNVVTNEYESSQKKERRPNTRHESFTISTNDFYTLCARENKNKNLVDIAHSNSRQ